MPRRTASLLYIGIRGRVVALGRHTGEEVWRADLKGSGFVQVTRDKDYVYAATKGEIFCLSPENGQVVWHNNLKGLGTDLVSLSSDVPMDASQEIGNTATLLQRQRAAAAAAAT